MIKEAQPRGTHVPKLKLQRNEVTTTITPEPFRQGYAQLGYYDMKNKLHGTAFIFNNEIFTRHENRIGTKRDEENLVQTFAFLGYRSVIFSNLTSEDMLYVFKNLDKYLEQSDKRATNKVEHDSFICCILTHGNQLGFSGSDSLLVKRDDIERAVGESTKLRGRPKIFFVQACRGSNPGTQPVLTVHADNTSRKADIYTCFATAHGDAAYRSEFKGSWFICEVCETMCKYGKNSKLSDIQLQLNQTVPSEKYRYTDMNGFVHSQQSSGATMLQHDVHFFDGEQWTNAPPQKIFRRVYNYTVFVQLIKFCS